MTHGGAVLSSKLLPRSTRVLIQFTGFQAQNLTQAEHLRLTKTNSPVCHTMASELLGAVSRNTEVSLQIITSRVAGDFDGVLVLDEHSTETGTLSSYICTRLGISQRNVLYGSPALYLPEIASDIASPTSADLGIVYGSLLEAQYEIASMKSTRRCCCENAVEASIRDRHIEAVMPIRLHSSFPQ